MRSSTALTVGGAEPANRLTAQVCGGLLALCHPQASIWNDAVQALPRKTGELYFVTLERAH